MLLSFETKFSHYTEYENIGKYFSVQGGFAFKSNLFEEDGIPVIRISDINSGTATTDGAVCYPPEIPIEKKFVVKQGDFLIAMSGATTGKTGIYTSKADAYLNQRVGKFVERTTDITSEYLSHMVLSNSYTESLNSLLIAGAQPNISPSDIESIKIPIFECDLREDITKVLTSLEAKIQRDESLYHQLVMLKTGLLQQMFI